MPAWGTSDGVQACAEEALQDFRRCDSEAPPCSPESLLALYRRALELHRYVADTRCGLLWEELGNRRRDFYSDAPEAMSYLVRGFLFRSDLDGEWEPVFPSFEVEGGQEWSGNKAITISFPSAFNIFVHQADYQAAHEITRLFPGAFTTPGLRGWKAAVRGFVAPDEAPERFAEAEAAFAEDVMPPSDELTTRRILEFQEHQPMGEILPRPTCARRISSRPHSRLGLHQNSRHSGPRYR